MIMKRMNNEKENIQKKKKLVIIREDIFKQTVLKKRLASKALHTVLQK